MILSIPAIVALNFYPAVLLRKQLLVGGVASRRWQFLRYLWNWLDEIDWENLRESLNWLFFLKAQQEDYQQSREKERESLNCYGI